MGLSDSAGALLVGGICVVAMFIPPLMLTTAKHDDIITSQVQSATTEFVTKVTKSGEFTLEDYDNLLQTVSATQHPYDIEITIQKADGNPEKKVAGEASAVGDDVYYEVHTTQVIEQLQNSPSHSYPLNEGDFIKVVVYNTDVTVAEQLKNWAYKFGGASEGGTIVAEDSAMVTTNGK